jgi:hypothetical protein
MGLYSSLAPARPRRSQPAPAGQSATDRGARRRAAAARPPTAAMGSPAYSSTCSSRPLPISAMVSLVLVCRALRTMLGCHDAVVQHEVLHGGCGDQRHAPADAAQARPRQQHEPQEGGSGQHQAVTVARCRSGFVPVPVATAWPTRPGSGPRCTRWPAPAQPSAGRWWGAKEGSMRFRCAGAAGAAGEGRTSSFMVAQCRKRA